MRAHAGSLALGKGTVTQSEVLGLPKAQLICLVGCESERRRHLLQRRLVGAAPSSQEHDALKVGHQGALDGWNPLQLRLKVGGSARHGVSCDACQLGARRVGDGAPAEREFGGRWVDITGRRLSAFMYHQGTFPEWRSPPPAPVFHRWPVAPPSPLSPDALPSQPDPLPSQPDLLPLTHPPPSAPPPNVGVDLFGATLLLVCVVNTLFTAIILYYTLRSLCHRRVTPPIPGRHYPAVSVLVPCYLPNEQGIIMGTIAHILRLGLGSGLT